MKKTKNMTIICVLIILFVVSLQFYLIINNKHVFGYSGDWLIQSVSFYEYFRDLFYETGEIFPNLSLHIGGGQNIYYFAYYGLFSPYWLLFCLFPNVSAGNFLIFTNFLNIFISSLLLYFFLVKNNYNKIISLFGALLLATCTCFSVCSICYIMFVQYIPFLILGLFGTKKYLDSGKSFLLVISVILIITTSYYFSIPSIICLCLYALYYYIKINNVVKIKNIFNTGFKYVLRILLGIVISCFLLLPVVFTILNGRDSVGLELSISSIFSKTNIYNLMYDSYGMGLSSIVCFSLIYNAFCLKKEKRLVSIILLIILFFPFINLALNGFMYTNGKVFIPFIPMVIIVISDMLNSIFTKKSKTIYLIFVITLFLCFVLLNFLSFNKTVVFCIDLLFTLIALLLCKKRKSYIYIFVVICFVMLVTIYYVKKRDLVMVREDYENVYKMFNNNATSGLLLEQIYRTMYDEKYIGINYSDASSVFSPTVYSSTYNKNYRKIFYDIFNNNAHDCNLLFMASTKNIFFNKFMGVKYLFSINDNIPYGYEKVKDYENISLYENNNVYSLGFTSSNLLSYDEYNELSFIEKLLVYQNNIIIDGESSNSDLDFNYEKVNLDYEVIKEDDLNIEYVDNYYVVKNECDSKIKIKLNKTIDDKILVIRFKVKNNFYSHVSITINDIKNLLSYDNFYYHNNNETFDYVISNNEGISELDIEFSKGIYEISDIEMYTVDNSFFDKNNTIPLNVDFTKTKGDDIYGSIDVSGSGYFIFTIPYDKGFTAYIDNKKVEIEQVNGGFIGFKINEGKHDIHLTFEAPYAKIGRYISLFGVVILILLTLYEKKICKKV